MAKSSVVFTVVLAISMLAVTQYVYAKISCEEVTALLIPCIPFAVLGGEVPPACCSGIKQSLALVKTKEDLRLKCECVIAGAAKIPGLSYERVNELPAKCGVKVPYVVSPKTNCSSLG